jgi:hypothetical protein
VQWEVSVQGDFVALCEPIASQATNAGSPTAVNASVSLPVGLDLVGKEVRLVVRSITFPELSYTSSPYTVTAVGTTLPNPAMTSATESANNVLTLQGSAGPSSLTSALVWFEVNDIGTGDFDARFGEQVLDVSGATTINASIALPNRLALNGRSVVLRVSPASRPDIIYTSTPLSITVSSFVDPLPDVTAANVSLAGVFTATGHAGVSDIGNANVWFEAAIDGNEFTALMEKQVVTTLGAGRQTINATVTLPTRFDLTGKTVRLVVQQVSRPDNVYYSATFPVTVVAPSPPSMAISLAQVSINDIFDATVTLGANNLGNVKTWWEVEVTTNEFTALFDTKATFALPAIGTVVNGSSPLPARFDLTGKNVRFAVQWLQKPEIVYYSSTFPVTVFNLTDPAPLITAFSADVWGACDGTVRAGPTNAAFCKVWWEVAIGTVGDFIALFDTEVNVNLFTQQTINTQFNLPRGIFGGDFDYAGKTIRVAVQPNSRPEVIFYSPSMALGVPARVDPEPVITLVAPAQGVMIVQGQAGPSNMGYFVWWVELEYNENIVVQSIDQPQVHLGSLFGINLPIPIPRGWNFNSKRVRLAFSPVLDRFETYYSPWYTLGSGFDNSDQDNGQVPGPIGGGSIPTPLAPGPGVWRTRTRDHSG